MSKKRFCVSMVVIAIVLGMVSRGPAWAQGTSAPAEQPAETITLKIDGLTCGSCVKDIRRALLAVPGVKAADVSYPRGGAIVAVEPGRVSPDQLIKAVEGTSTLLSTYRATVIPNGTLGR
ncbi:MAG: heavy-metal-associated domain-containing protein [Nitrospiraceae bacterium]